MAHRGKERPLVLSLEGQILSSVWPFGVLALWSSGPSERQVPGLGGPGYRASGKQLISRNGQEGWKVFGQRDLLEHRAGLLDDGTVVGAVSDQLLDGLVQ